MIAEETTALLRRVIVDSAGGNSASGADGTQYAFLLQTLARPHAGLGVLQTTLRFHEDFDGRAFHRFVQRIVDREPSLQRSFLRIPGGFEERAAVCPQVPVKVLDWRGLSEAAAATEWEALLQTDRALGFDPALAPLLRCTYVQFAARHTRVLLTNHHLLMDGVALSRVLRDAVEQYDRARQGEPPEPGEAVARKPRAAAAVQASPHGLPHAQAQAYWREALRELQIESPLAALRTPEHSPPATQCSTSVHLPAGMERALQTAAAHCGCSPAALVYAAWAVTLYRLAQQPDIAFLTIRSARAQANMARELGSFVQSSPLRLRVEEGARFAELAQQADAFLEASGPYTAARLAELKEWTGVPESLWDSNLLFDRERFAPWFRSSGASAGSRTTEGHQYSDVPLTVAVMRDDGLRLNAQYWPAAFRPGTVAELLESLGAILQHAVHTPLCTVGELPWITGTQRKRLLLCAQAGPVPAPVRGMQQQLLHNAFMARAANGCPLPAVQGAEGCRTYAQIDEASDVIAARLLQQGLTHEEPVAVLIERSAAHLVALLGVLKAGGAYLPLEPAHPEAHLQRIAAAAGIRMCLAGARTRAGAAALGAQVLCVTGMEQKGPEDNILLPVPEPSQLAYLIATSGTTGLPKLVEVEHRAAANTLRHSVEALYRLGDLDLVPWTDSPAGDASIHQIFAALSCGGTLEPVASVEALRTSPNFGRFTTFGGTPSVLELLLATNGVPPRARTVLIGGEACPEELPARLRAQTGIRRLINVYGPTETAIYSTAYDLMDDDAVAQGISIGRPIRNTRIAILGSTRQPVLPGAVGELYIAGAGLARGYRDNPEATAKSFVSLHGLDTHAQRFYRTGDLAAWLPDGRLELHGRVDRQVKIFGVRMELDDIERRLERLPGVARALVAASADIAGRDRLTAWLVAQAGHTLAEEEIRRLTRVELPSSMVPGTIVFVDRIPLTPAGKPDFAQLPRGADQSAAQPVRRSGTPQWSEREQAIASLWRRLLEHNAFGADDDFFSVGGDSLLALELVLDLNELFQIQLSSAMVRGAWTISAIAAASEEAPSAHAFFAVGQHLRGTPQFWLMPNADDFALFERSRILQPLYLLCAEPLETNELSIEAYAAEVARQIRAVQPIGPYRIGGYCFAGFIAFEVARHLMAGGAELANLCIVDRVGPTQLYRWTEHARRMLHGELLPTPPWPGWARRGRLMREFRPGGKLAAPVMVVETSHSRKRYNPDPLRGWGGWVTGRLKVYAYGHMMQDVGLTTAVRLMAEGREHDQHERKKRGATPPHSLPASKVRQQPASVLGILAKLPREVVPFKSEDRAPRPGQPPL